MIRNLSIVAAAFAGALSIQAASAETVKPWWDHVWGASAVKSSDNAVVARMNAEYERTIADIEDTLGVVPEFFALFPTEKLPGVWQAYKAAELNPGATLDGKTRQLIALAAAIASGSPATIYLHTTAALANGASAKEIQETVAVAEIGGTWSDVLTAEHEHTVRGDADALFRLGTLDVSRAVPMN